MRIPIGVAAAALVANTAASQTITVTSSSPVEAKLASLDAGSKVVQQSRVKVYAGVLDSVDRKCKENRVQIGDITAKGVELLAEKKVKMTYLKFLQSLDGSMPPGSETLNLSCVEIAAMLTTMIDRP